MNKVQEDPLHKFSINYIDHDELTEKSISHDGVNQNNNKNDLNINVDMEENKKNTHESEKKENSSNHQSRSNVEDVLYKYNVINSNQIMII
jgi:hypothetical protein